MFGGAYKCNRSQDNSKKIIINKKFINLIKPNQKQIKNKNKMVGYFPQSEADLHYYSISIPRELTNCIL